MHRSNIRDMYAAVETGRGFDVIVAVSSSAEQGEFWQERLEASRGTVIGHKTQVISMEEDWVGGAGQLLGTLYAWKMARTNHNLMQLLQDGRSIAMYHTAGKGTRMAPIPTTEANNKSAIKLPRMLYINGEKKPFRFRARKKSVKSSSFCILFSAGVTLGSCVCGGPFFLRHVYSFQNT